MFQEYIQKSTKKVVHTIELAVADLAYRRQNQLTPDFILLALFAQSDSEAIKILDQIAPNPIDTISQIKEKIFKHNHQAAPSNANQIVGTPELTQLFQIAYNESESLGDKFISTGTLFVALFDPSIGHTADFLKDAGLKRKQALKALKEHRNGGNIGNANAEEEADVLARYTQDLTQLARDGLLDPVIGREKEIALIIQTLSRRKKNNPVLIGEAGVGKTVIVEHLAQCIAEANVPETLLNKRLLSLDMGEIVAGASMRGEFEERLKQVRDAVIEAKGQVILFIDELHTVVGAGSNAGGIDAPSMLKTALAQGSLQVIGADTLDEYRKYVEADKALERRFHSILVREPSVEETIDILTGISPRYEEHHQVKYDAKALEAAAKLSERYISDRHLPDKAVDLMDEAGSRRHIRLISIPTNVRKLELEYQKLQRKKSDEFNKKNFESATNMQMESLELEEKLKSEHSKWARERGQVDSTVTDEDIAEVVSSWTGIPVVRMVESEAKKLTQMENNLHKRIIGQNDAVRAVADAIRRNRAGIGSQSRPIGSFLFLGPTGVGKTELARALAAYLLDDEARIISLDMSEYMERHEVSKMIGALHSED